RNRKPSVGGFMPRRATRWEVQLRDDERRALAAVEDYVLNGFNLAESTRDNAIGFVMVIFQKLMASSSRALRQSLAARRERIVSKAIESGIAVSELELRLDDETKTTREIVGSAGAAYATEVADLARLVGLLDAVQIDSKAEALLQNLE